MIKECGRARNFGAALFQGDELNVHRVDDSADNAL